MRHAIHVILGIAIGGIFAGSAGATVIFSQGFEADTPAAEFASGDFDPAHAMGFGHYPLEFTDETLVQVVNKNTTTANGSPIGGVQAHSGDQSLKIDASSGLGTPWLELEPMPAETPAVRSTTFHVYGVTGDSVGGGRLFEVWIDDTSTGSGVDVWSIRVDENGDLYYENTTSGWVDTGVDITHGQWNKFTMAADAGAGLVNMWVNDVPVGGNIYRGTGDTLDQFVFQANVNAGTGAGVFYDDILIDDAFVPEPSTLLLCVAGGALVALRRRMHRA